MRFRAPRPLNFHITINGRESASVLPLAFRPSRPLPSLLPLRRRLVAVSLRLPLRRPLAAVWRRLQLPLLVAVVWLPPLRQPAAAVLPLLLRQLVVAWLALPPRPAVVLPLRLPQPHAVVSLLRLRRLVAAVWLPLRLPTAAVVSPPRLPRSAAGLLPGLSEPGYAAEPLLRLEPQALRSAEVLRFVCHVSSVSVSAVRHWLPQPAAFVRDGRLPGLPLPVLPLARLRSSRAF